MKILLLILCITSFIGCNSQSKSNLSTYTDSVKSKYNLDTTVYEMINEEDTGTIVSQEPPTTPMIIDGQLYILVAGYKDKITDCNEYKDFKRRFPYFIIDKSILSHFKNCHN